MFTYKIIKDVKDITGINFFKKKREMEYVEARSFFVHILKNYYKLRNKDIIILFNDMGFAMDSATLCHSLKMFEIYNNNNQRMRDWFGALFEIPDFKNIANARAYIRLKVNDLPDDAIFKMAAQMQSMLKDEEYENVTYEW